MSHTTTQLISKFRASGLSQKDFCSAQKIPLSTLRYHIYKKSNPHQAIVSKPKFIALPNPAVQSSAQSGTTIVIIRGLFAPTQISEIVNAGGSH